MGLPFVFMVGTNTKTLIEDHFTRLQRHPYPSIDGVEVLDPSVISLVEGTVLGQDPEFESRVCL